MNKETMRIEEFLLIISFLILIIGLLWQANIGTPGSDLPPVERIQNMLAAPPIAANTYLEDYSLYVPQGYKVDIVDNTIIVYNKESIITFYLGQGVELTSALFDKMNTDLELLYSQSVSTDGVLTYTYAWRYDESHIELLLGQNDSYIVAVYPESKLDEGVTDSTLMFNSYQAIND